jgi:hypothetical protein
MLNAPLIVRPPAPVVAIVPALKFELSVPALTADASATIVMPTVWFALIRPLGAL